MNASMLGRPLWLAVVCACLPLTAHATAYKCSLPGGGTAYQDSPCQNGAAQQSVELSIASSGLVTLVSDVAVLGLHVAARKQKQLGYMPDAVANCVMAVKGKDYDGAVQKALSTAMNTADLQTANSFFASPAGRKLGKMILAQSYQSLGEQAPEAAPALNDEEAYKLEVFVHTSAGQILVNQRFIANSDVTPIIRARGEELKKNCGWRK